MEAVLFLLGFSAVVTTYEIAKSSKGSKSDKLNKSISSAGKKFPRL